MVNDGLLKPKLYIMKIILSYPNSLNKIIQDIKSSSWFANIFGVLVLSYFITCFGCYIAISHVISSPIIISKMEFLNGWKYLMTNNRLWPTTINLHVYNYFYMFECHFKTNLVNVSTHSRCHSFILYRKNYCALSIIIRIPNMQMQILCK